MAVDSRSKRASIPGLLSPFILAPVLPDGTIDQADRQHIAWVYSGILAGAFIPRVISADAYCLLLAQADAYCLLLAQADAYADTVFSVDARIA